MCAPGPTITSQATHRSGSMIVWSRHNPCDGRRLATITVEAPWGRHKISDFGATATASRVLCPPPANEESRLVLAVTLIGWQNKMYGVMTPHQKRELKMPRWVKAQGATIHCVRAVRKALYGSSMTRSWHLTKLTQGGPRCGFLGP